MELGKTFEPKAAEEHWFQRWIDLGYFKADPARKGPVFSIVIPPVNVTGQLHIGHALNHTLQDVIVRMRRMQGYNTLWLPGTDHAGIATQNAVERQLALEKRNRHQLGREAFVDRVWQWREEKGGRIQQQMRQLGDSCDWSRERFTLDQGLSRAVTKAFVDLYDQGFLYRDRRMINWCPRCETTLSDLEVDHKETASQLYFIRYPLVDRGGAITVATTRPETMLGDTAVAVHPQDGRNAAMIGRKLRLPLVGREIAVIADAVVEREFGTGAVKVTPAHDPADFEIGRRHGLEQIQVIDTRGRMNENAGAYRGLSREDARRRILDDLKSAELLEKAEPLRHAVGCCSRCGTVVEPMLSEQWFLNVKQMAARAIAAVKEGRTTFHPKFWENTFFNWMENIHDWCVSRQLWWGHRIPAWRCERCGKLIVAAERPQRCPECEGVDLKADDDVLDTWFSSALWPFSTLGWPERTRDLEKYYPTTLLVTGFDIIFFWVARMMMMALHFTGEVPFKDVYLTTLVRDQYGKKMTKSKGNVVDPLEIMDKYGTDAVRFTLAQMAIQGRELVISDYRLAASRAFANKIWNAARFVMMNMEGAVEPLAPVAAKDLGLADRWILSRLDRAVGEVTSAVDRYEFNVAAMAVYQFIWHEFCDWYIELAKEPLRAGGARQDAARHVLIRCLDRMLRLLHPFMPFLTEELWQAIRPYVDEPGLAPHLVIAKFPAASAARLLAPAEETAMAHCIEAVEALNSLRVLLGFHPGQRIDALITPRLAAIDTAPHKEAAVRQEVRWWGRFAEVMAKLSKLEAVSAEPGSDGRRYVKSVLDWCELLVAAPEEFDFDKARALLRKRLDETTSHLEQHRARLANPDFMQKADDDTREHTRRRAEELDDERIRLGAHLRSLEDAP